MANFIPPAKGARLGSNFSVMNLISDYKKHCLNKPILPFSEETHGKRAALDPRVSILSVALAGKSMGYQTHMVIVKIRPTFGIKEHTFLITS